jgi:Zn-dependent peptidase ImmA (M78 family)/DNA-binding XRE family transcriptional regulator
MKEIVAKRIKSARTLAGLSLRELSEKLDGLVSYNAISKYEKAQMMPDSKVMLQLAKVLNVKLDYFFRPFSISIENIEFRKKSKLGVKKVASIKEEVIDSITRYIEIEQFLNLASNFKNPIKNIVIADGDAVEKAVNQLIKDWNIGINALPNVIELLEDKEIKVIEIDADADFDGFSGWATGNIPVIVINAQFPVERKRFTALHELGHLLLNFNNTLSEKEIERLCHRFAGAILMPQETFLHELGKQRSKISVSELIAIKETYGISIQAIMARAKDLGVIPEEHFINFRRWVNQDPNRKKEINLGSFQGRERSSRFKQLLYRAAAEDLVSLNKAASLANMKVADFRKEFVLL